MSGTKEVFLAVIATTVALVAVFLPILFLGGMVGQLFREFAVVLAGTVIISSFVALTLTPMLCARILHAHEHSRFYELTEPVFQKITGAYRRVLERFLAVRWLAWPILVVAGGLAWWSFQQLDSELAPVEDRGRLRVVATAPEGASYDYMLAYMDQLHAAAVRETPESAIIISVTAPGMGAASSVNSGFLRMFLTDRTERDRSQSEVARRLLTVARGLPGARVVVIEDPTISLGVGAGARLPVQFVIEAPNLAKLRAALPEFLARAETNAAFARVDVDLKFNKPELRVAVDRERAQALGVSGRDIGDTLNLALAEQRFGFFLRDGKQYHVLGALVRDQREDGLELRSLSVPSRSGEPVRLDNVTTVSEQASPPQLFRFNRYSSATVSASLNPGYTLSRGVAAMEQIAAEALDETFETDLAGEARDLRETAAGTVFAFVFALALIYFVLAAQFESYRDPFIILLTVPLALVGAVGLLWATGQTLNIFSQIGMIMLIGLVTKNGILIVEFANQQRELGLAPLDAVREAAVIRFRPVLMTALSTILGILPIALAFGAGSESRRSMGIAVVGGMTLATALTLLVIPAVYSQLATRRFHRAA